MPTVLALFSVVSALFQPDKETLSHLFEYVLPMAISNTVWLMLGVAITTMLLGVSLAWLTSVYEFPFCGFFAWALILPMAIPGYVMAFSLVGFFEYSGPLQIMLREWFGSSAWFPDINSFGGVVIALSFALYPYTYMMSRNAFLTQGRKSLEVGQSLGFSIKKSFWKICLPMARPWIIGGTLLVVMETLSDFGTVSVFNYDTLTSAIYKSWFDLYSLPAALQVASVLLLFVVVITLLERKSRETQRFSQSSNALLTHDRIRLSRGFRWSAFSFCSFIFIAAFLLPCVRLLWWALPNLEIEITSQLVSYILGSITLALTAMFLVAGTALLTAFAARTQNSSFSSVAVRISTLGYAVPGTVLAVGLFSPIALVDKWLAALGVNGPVLQGTLVVMMLAYTVRFMAVAFTPLENNLLRITPSIDCAAKSLGVSGFAMLKKIHLPMLKGGIATAMILVFVDVMKELPITLMTRPFGFDTLAVRIFELSSEGLWERAALPALAIVLVGLIPAFLLIRRSSGYG